MAPKPLATVASRTLAYLIIIFFYLYGVLYYRVAFGVDVLSAGSDHLIRTCAMVLLVFPSMSAVCFGQV